MSWGSGSNHSCVTRREEQKLLKTIMWKYYNFSCDIGRIKQQVSLFFFLRKLQLRTLGQLYYSVYDHFFLLVFTMIYSLHHHNMTHSNSILQAIMFNENSFSVFKKYILSSIIYNSVIKHFSSFLFLISICYAMYISKVLFSAAV